MDNKYDVHKLTEHFKFYAISHRILIKFAGFIVNYAKINENNSIIQSLLCNKFVF